LIGIIVVIVGPPIVFVVEHGLRGLALAIVGLLFVGGCLGAFALAETVKEKRPDLSRTRGLVTPQPAPSGGYGVQCAKCNEDVYASEIFTYHFGRKKGTQHKQAAFGQATVRYEITDYDVMPPGAYDINICTRCIWNERLRQVQEEKGTRTMILMLIIVGALGLIAFLAVGAGFVLNENSSGLSDILFLILSLVMIGTVFFSLIVLYNGRDDVAIAQERRDRSIGEELSRSIAKEISSSSNWDTIWTSEEFARLQQSTVLAEMVESVGRT
jgi:hypothetical protein